MLQCANHYRCLYFTHTEYLYNAWFHLYVFEYNLLNIYFSFYIFTSSQIQFFHCRLFLVHLSSTFTCISQTHAWLLVENAHVTLFHGYSSSVLAYHVPRGVLPAWVLIGSIRVCATTDLIAGWTASTNTLTLNVLAWNVIIKLPCTYWYWFLCFFIHIVVSFCRKRDRHVKIFILMLVTVVWSIYII